MPCVLYDIYKTDETGRHWLGSRSTLAQAEKQIKQLKNMGFRLTNETKLKTVFCLAQKG